MIKKLYDWQEDLISRIVKSLRENQSIIAHAPTGGGKSVIISNIANRGIAKGNTVLVLSETRKIYDQLVDECSGIEINSKVKHRSISLGKCYVGMIQTLQRRPLILEQLKALGRKLIVMVDECHIRNGYDTLIELREAGVYIIGFTATPFCKFSPHLPEIYNDLVEGPQVDELIQMGFLCSYQHIARTRSNMDLLEVRNGEFTEKSQDIAFNNSVVYDGLFEDLRAYPFKKCVIFVASIKHANELSKKLNDNGFPASCYHSKTEHGRYEMAKFTELGLTNIMVTIKSLSKGWDFKPIDLVVLNHATLSLPVYLQELGRGSRVIFGIKTHFRTLDYGENYLRHGLYFEDRDYKNLWKTPPPKGKKGEGVAPVALCPSCESIISTTQRICPFCGHERPLTEKELEQGELVEVTSHYTSLIGRKISELTPNELAIYAKMKKKQVFATRVAKAKEQVQKGFLSAFGAAMGYKSTWVDIQSRMIGANTIEFTDIQLR
ncbi:Predicted HKD family nuclease [Sphingobacterium multivorum]|uniref:DEAD/DEAH box helicase n=1 Tax=Sphingobacterium multivorum TaxID=28454 RepID=UPI000DFD2541|nr:DEAD/DEAH box helicase family protein [Sphingobacterium multivorum]QQT44871.1 DEAD/DEAH box helicase family protein [Sphingobacterium multivorum]SUJ18187.1 Predicted HKD family nuclease [Sphingobacterium multivorum]